MVINITAERYKNGKLTKLAGTLQVPEVGMCVFVIRPSNDISYFYTLTIKDAYRIVVTNFERMIEQDWKDRTMVKWIGDHARGILELAMTGTCKQAYVL